MSGRREQTSGNNSLMDGCSYEHAITRRVVIVLGVSEADARSNGLQRRRVRAG